MPHKAHTWGWEEHLVLKLFKTLLLFTKEVMSTVTNIYFPQLPSQPLLCAGRSAETHSWPSSDPCLIVSCARVANPGATARSRRRTMLRVS